MTGRGREIRRLWLWLALATLVVLVATLVPAESPEAAGRRISLCLLCGSRGAALALLNVLLFLPLGVAAGAAWGTAGVAFLAAPLLSLLVETLQVAVPGRNPSLGDLLFNTLGGTAGVLLVRHREALLRPSPEGAARRCATAGFLAACAFAATGLLLEPSLTRAPYYGQWTPELGHLEAYAGRVLAARVGGVPVPVGRFEDTERLRGLLLAGAAVEAEVAAGPAPPGLAPVFSIYDRGRQEILLLGADRTHLVYRIRRRAAALRLDQPDARLPGALRGVAAGEAVRLAAQRREGELCLVVHPGPARCGVGPSVGDGWALLLYPERAGPAGRRGLTALWVGLLLAPVGFWLLRRPLCVLGLVLPLAALAIVPRATAAEGAPPEAYLGAMAGIAAGVGAGAAARRGPGGRAGTGS